MCFRRQGKTLESGYGRLRSHLREMGRAEGDEAGWTVPDMSLHNEISVARDIFPRSGGIGFLLECREDANDASPLQEKGKEEKGKEEKGKEGVADAGNVIDEEAGESNRAEGGREKHDEPHVIDFLADDVAHGPVVDCRLEEIADKGGVGGGDVAEARDEEPIQQEIRRCGPEAAVHDVTRFLVVVEDVGVEVVVDLEKHAGLPQGPYTVKNLNPVVGSPYKWE